jgi:RNA polymerase sigma-70 factor (ECF subfamily)
MTNSPQSLPTTVPTGSPDAEVVVALKAGDERAFEWVVRQHGGRMLAVASRLLRHEQEAQDAVQEAFLSAFRAIDRFDGKSQLGTWLHRIVVNASLMRLRTRRSRPERQIDDLLPRFAADGHQASAPTPWGESAEIAAQRAETRALIRDCIDRLPEAYRTVLLLRDIEGLDTDETACLLEVTVPVVKTRLHRARQALKTLLDLHFRREAL